MRIDFRKEFSVIVADDLFQEQIYFFPQLPNFDRVGVQNHLIDFINKFLFKHFRGIVLKHNSI